MVVPLRSSRCLAKGNKFFAVNTTLASANQELTYYNKAVVDHALQPPPWECSDMDLRLTIQEEAVNKPLRKMGP